MKGHFVYGILRSARNHFRGSRTPPISFTGTRHARSFLIIILHIAAREHPRAGSKQMATYQAVVLNRRVAAAHQNCAAQLPHKLGRLITSLARSYTISTMHHQ